MSEQKAYEPDTGEVEFDPGDAQETEVEIPAREDPEPPAADSDFGSSDDSDDSNEQERYSESAQKRINRLTKKMREAERQREEALRYAQQVQSEAQQMRQRMQQLDQGYMNEYGGRLKTETEVAEAQLKRAVELGDSDQIVESQRRLSQLYAAAEKYQSAKQQQEQYLAQAQEAARRQPEQAYAPQQQAQPQQVRRPDPKAEDWATRNTWFGQDEAMTFAAFGIHKKLVEDEGFDPESDEYYSELDRRIRREFPQKFSGSGKRAAQTVAGVSRGGSTTSARGKKVRLTPTQVSIANRLGVPLEKYAEYVKE